MPARVIRAEINASESLSRVSMQADLTFRALIVAVDDYGRIDGRLPYLKAQLYPMRPDVTLKQLDSWLKELEAGPHPPVERYTVDGRVYLHLVSWETHRGKSNRAMGSKCPEPPSGRSAEILESPGNPPEGMESGVWSRESGVGGDVRDSPPGRGAGRSAASRSPSPLESTKKIPKPVRFTDEAREDIVAWAKRRKFRPRILDEGQQAWEAWGPAKDFTRPLSSWVASFKGLINRKIADGTIELENPDERAAREAREFRERAEQPILRAVGDDSDA